MRKSLGYRFREIVDRKTQEQTERLKAKKLAESRKQKKQEQLKAMVQKAMAKAEKILNGIFKRAPEIRQYVETRSGAPLYIFDANGVEKTEARRMKVTGKVEDALGLGIRGKTVELLGGDNILGRAVWTTDKAGSTLCLVHDSQSRLCIAIMSTKRTYGVVFTETNSFNTDEMLTVLAKFGNQETAMEMLVEQLG
ncbi:MAG: hypothetical protein WC250_02790 [Candidatus Paceibacterota bacterium]|jgi:hypothetical protein